MIKGKRMVNFICSLPGLYNNKGQVSIFLAIIFLSVLVLSGIFIDAARIRAGEAHVKRSVENAARSALALYNSRLKESYGLFAMGEIDEAKIEEDIKRYISMNLSSNHSGAIPCNDNGTGNVTSNGNHKSNGNENFIDLYGFRIEEVKVMPIFSFMEKETLRKQVLEYMKYRVPEKIFENLLKKIGIFKEVGTMAEAYGKKAGIDENLGKLEDVRQGFITSISGNIGDAVYTGECVNNFNENGARDQLAARYAGLLEEYKNLMQNFDGVQDAMEKRVQFIREEIDKVHNELKEKQTRSFIQINRKAVESAGKLLELSNMINLGIEELKQFIDAECETWDMNGCMNTSTDVEINAGMNNDMNVDIKKYSIFPGQEFKNILMGEVEIMRVLIPGEAGIKTMISGLENNIRALEKAESILGEIYEEVDMNDIRDLTWDGVYESLTRVNLDYKKIDYGSIPGIMAYGPDLPENCDLEGNKYKGDDPREIIENIARNFVKNDEKDNIDMRDAGININELPSNKKFENANFSEDGEYYPGNNTTCFARYEYEEEIDELGKEIEFSKTSAAFPQKAINFISILRNMFAGELENLRDKVYINEYVLEMFKNHLENVNSTGGGAGAGNANKKGARESFFNAEIEYILHGSPSENINILKTKYQILLVRFILNTLHVYTDAAKNRQAALMASALAGWWTGGAGIPIVKNLIMCAWGMGEAIIDLKELYKGKKVPLYKTNKDWKLDLDMETDAGGTMEHLSANAGYETNDTGGENKPGEENKSDENIFNLSYRDYLRMFLLLCNTEEVLGRMQDLIEINMQKIKPGFKIENSYAGIKVEAAISMKYMFLTKNFMPSNIKTRDGRHIFRVILYEMY